MSTAGDRDTCLGPEVAPREVYNRPGLSALDYRVGTHAHFKASMLARISAHPGLAALSTRADDDFAIALCDAFAVVADILCFYQERIANESYLGTATERRSLFELARLIGYRPRPGVAAGTWLAFTVEAPTGLGTAPSATPEGATAVRIPPGLRVQSVPVPGEDPQVFETVEAIEAYPEWNTIKPRLTRPQPLGPDLQSVTGSGFAGLLPNRGDTVLLVTGPADEDPAIVVMRVARVVEDPGAGTTRLALAPPPLLAEPPPPPLPAQPPLPASVPFIPPIRGRFFTGPARLSDTFVGVAFGPGIAWRQDLVLSLAHRHRWGVKQLERRLNSPPLQDLPEDRGVFAFRTRAALFGHNAPKQGFLAAGPPDAPGQTVADRVLPDGHTILQDEQTDDGRNFVYLDRSYPGIVPGGYVVLESPSAREVYQVGENTELSRAAFGLSAKVTRLSLDRRQGFERFLIRETTVYAESEALTLAPLPIEDPVAGSALTLDGAYLGLGAGRRLVVEGELADLHGVRAAEAVRIAEAILEDGHTRLRFETALAQSYVRKDVTLNANVAAATHGETRTEVLGAGLGGQAYQGFRLRQPPLTYVTAPTASGSLSTLKLWVNERLWEEVPSLYGHGPSERVYKTYEDEEGNTFIRFGDGTTGARLPTGQENVKVEYRRGSGAAGRVKAGQLSLLLARPLGVREVQNPRDAEGGADPDGLSALRRSAPLALRSLERVVSLRDYEDFARAFAGIEKAQAALGRGHGARAVLLTIAGIDGAVIEPQGPLALSLAEAIRAAGNPWIPLLLVPHRPMFFRFAARLRIAPGFRPEPVIAAVHGRLREGFGFEARALGQPVALSEVLAAIHAIAGVEAVQMSAFRRIDEAPAPQIPALLAADPPGAGLGAELLLIDPGILTEVVGTLT